MHIHLVHAHPDSASFTAAMRDMIVETATGIGHTVTVSDLYKMNFNPVLSAADFGERRDPDHLTYALEQRHNWKQNTLAPDIASEIARVLAADVLAFTFPLHWFGTPAILKGWIERVFISGPFYGGKRVYGAGGLAGKRAFAAFGLGGRPHMFGPGSIHGPLVDGMMKHFFQGTLGYVGLRVLEPFIAWHVPYVAEDDRTLMLADLAQYVRTLDDQPVLEMPDLASFDETFGPK
ncbi:MAG: NAD(P)H-dependent oxidoreductase [Rhodospirillales bacterium]|nr:NAD(P)H-dependent oxidoreductase [Rhodospirillales bacterium]MBO6786855.1 NAD(P)H-dependent oxidoreductase [Rhodospirillales bacterium]